jgi:copper chaperone CopZ
MKRREEPIISDTNTMTLEVVGEQTLHCGGCERTVKFTLSQLPGVRVIDVDHTTQLIKIALAGDETDFEKVRAELEWIGYQVVAA